MEETPNPNKQEKLENKTMSKNMRNTEDILLDLAAGVTLDPDEERLADRMMYEKHGQRVGSFKTSKKTNDYEFPIIMADGTVIEPANKKAKKTVQKEYQVKLDGNAPIGSDVVVKAADFVS